MESGLSLTACRREGLHCPRKTEVHTPVHTAFDAEIPLSRLDCPPSQCGSGRPRLYARLRQAFKCPCMPFFGLSGGLSVETLTGLFTVLSAKARRNAVWGPRRTVPSKSPRGLRSHPCARTGGKPPRFLHKRLFRPRRRGLAMPRNAPARRFLAPLTGFHAEWRWPSASSPSGPYVAFSAWSGVRDREER